jgi:predicted RNA binding protein YcfA (HicA-like mRNA interferase family)
MLSSKKIIAALIADGWVQVHQKRSHVQFRHPRKLGRVTVPHPKKDLPLGTIRSIEQQSGVKLT